MSTLKRQARIAGCLYLLLAILGPIALIYVPGRLMVAGDAAATADNLRALEGLVRLGIGIELLTQLVWLCVALALYRLLGSVNEAHARLMVILGPVLSLPIMFVNVLSYVAALALAEGADYLSVFDPSQLDALAYLSLHLHGRGFAVCSIFWGLWLFPFALLVIRSGFIPRLLGYLLMIAGLGYLASAFAVLVAPQLKPLISKIALPMELGELAIIVWLLVWGARTPPADAARRS